ncbi:MAG: inositol monophosphatase [Deltaproteobacteria bacterium]|nr:inositol monophosphatase [Deltaproteobacteria bacterium]
MMSLDECADAADELLRITTEAAQATLARWRTPLEVTHKGAIDLVTQVDLSTEALLRKRLTRAFPGCDLVGEETGGEASGTRPVLYLDPLDGTTNYAHGHAFFCTTVALCIGDQAVAGAVVAPALGWSYVASSQRGARRNGALVRVSRATSLDAALLATGFPYDLREHPENNLREFNHLAFRCQGIRRCGSAALDLCLTADGTYDAYWERKLKPWDLAAGSLFVREAGGVVTDTEGGPLSLLRGSLLATNGALHLPLVEALREARERPVVTPA